MISVLSTKEKIRDKLVDKFAKDWDLILVKALLSDENREQVKNFGFLVWKETYLICHVLVS
jgi:hypothetical protein